jgi:hypothetical protein
VQPLALPLLQWLPPEWMGPKQAGLLPAPALLRHQQQQQHGLSSMAAAQCSYGCCRALLLLLAKPWMLLNRPQTPLSLLQLQVLLLQVPEP